MYESSDRTEYSGWNSPEPDLRYLTRVNNSVRIAKSIMSGVARRES